ncbi:hypothetical protein ACOSQ2_022441 [Xanthoceras sorbifolium]
MLRLSDPTCKRLKALCLLFMVEGIALRGNHSCCLNFSFLTSPEEKQIESSHPHICSMILVHIATVDLLRGRNCFRVKTGSELRNTWRKGNWYQMKLLSWYQMEYSFGYLINFNYYYALMKLDYVTLYSLFI